MVIIVPNQDSHASRTFRNAFRLIIVLIWICTAIGFTTIRILFQKLLKSSTTNFTVTSIFFNTLGISLGTISRTKTNSVAERILTFIISIFAVLGCLMFSGYLFQQFTKHTSTSNIETLAELKQIHLPLMVDNIFLNVTKKIFG